MEIEVSRDKTTKFNFDDGYSAVLIPLGTKKTLCLSTQVGCPMRCSFCFSGKKQFKRNLTLDELKEQLEVAIEHLAVQDLNSRSNTKSTNYLADHITTIVFMGMGEPMLNLDNVLRFCDYVNHEYGYSYSKISISTSGIIPPMYEVIENINKIQLAVSLHSPNQEIRDKIMPNVSNYPVKDLIKACNAYNDVYRQKIMIEYVMIKGLNDRQEDLDALINLGLAKRTNFNLITLNGTFELEGKIYESSDDEIVAYFRDKLMQAGYKCFTRKPMGTDIEAACGMLK